MIQFDTSFLIDLQLEILQERPGAAFAFIETLDQGELLAVSVHVVAELRVGPERTTQQRRDQQRIDDLLAGFLTLYPDKRYPLAYARLWAATNRKRRSIASMDLLIATAAIIEDAPLVTKNVKDFSRLPGLRVLSY